MSGVRRIGKNAVMIFLARGIDLVSVLIIIALLTRYLGVETYGKYAVVMALVYTLASFAHMGMPKILIREISQDKRSANNFIGAALIFTAIMSIVVVLISSVIIFSLKLEKMLVIAFGIAIGAEMILVFSGCFMSIFIAFEKMRYDTIVTTLYRLIFFLCLILVIYLKLNFIYIFLCMVVANSAGFLIARAISLSKFNINPKFDKWKSNLKYLFIETLPVGASFVIFQLYQYVDIFVLKILRGFSDVALFQAPYLLILKLQFFPRVLIITFAPVFARLASIDLSHSKLSYIYPVLLKYFAIFSIPFVVLGMVYADKIVLLIFGSSFSKSAMPFQILICGLPLILMYFLSDTVLVSIGKQKLIFISILSAFIMNLVLDLILVRSYGYIGASIASLIAIICLFVLNFYFVSKYLKNVSLFAIFNIPGLAGILMGVFLLKFDTLNIFVSVMTGFTIYLSILFISKFFSKKEILKLADILNQT